MLGWDVIDEASKIQKICISNKFDERVGPSRIKCNVGSLNFGWVTWVYDNKLSTYKCCIISECFRRELTLATDLTFCQSLCGEPGWTFCGLFLAQISKGRPKIGSLVSIRRWSVITYLRSTASSRRCDCVAASSTNQWIKINLGGWNLKWLKNDITPSHSPSILLKRKSNFQLDFVWSLTTAVHVTCQLRHPSSLALATAYQTRRFQHRHHHSMRNKIEAFEKFHSKLKLPNRISWAKWCEWFYMRSRRQLQRVPCIWKLLSCQPRLFSRI